MMGVEQVWRDAHRGLNPGQLIVGVDRQTKAGGSHFALTFPEPIYVLNLDFGLKEALAKFPDKLVQEALVRPIDLTYDAYRGALNEAWKDWKQAVHEAEEAEGTVVIDQSTLLWHLIYTVVQGDETGKKASDEVVLEKMLPFKYANANTKMTAFLQLPAQFDHVSAVFIDRVKPARDSASGKVIPGEWDRQGFGGLEAAVPLALRLEYHQDTDSRTALVTACRKEPKYFGMEIADPSYDSVLEALN